MRTLMLVLMVAQLCACATPEAIRNLARSTGPLVAETQGSASAVQKRFAQQNAVVEGRIARWNEYAAGSRAIAETPVALWTVDSEAGGSGAAQGKARLLMLERVRASDDAPTEVQPDARTPASPPISVSSAQLILLLDGLARGKLMNAGTFAAWMQATDQALADLKQDAEAPDPAQEQ